MPPAIYFYFAYPDWCLMYWLDSRYLSLPLVFSLYALYYLFITLGFSLSSFLERYRKGISLKVVGWTLLLFLLFSLLTFKRLLFVGTIEQFRAGTLPFLIQLPGLFFIVLGSIILPLIILVVILSYFGSEFDQRWSKEDNYQLNQRARVVSLVRVEEDVKEAIYKSLELWEGIPYLKKKVLEKGKRIIIKPNLAGGGKNKLGTQTHPLILSAVIDILRESLGEVDITIVEADSILWKMSDVLRGSQYMEIFKRKKVKFINLTEEELVSFDFGGRLGEEFIPQILLRGDLLIDLPVAKTHYFYKMSGAVKNLFGLLPIKQKFFRYHTKGFADHQGKIFIDIYRHFPPDLVILDGIISHQGQGPVGGRPLKTNFVITSDEALCVDLVLAQIMGFEPKEIPYLKALYEEGLKCDYRLLGASLKSIKPASWEQANLFGFLVSLKTVLPEQIRINWERIRSWVVSKML